MREVPGTLAHAWIGDIITPLAGAYSAVVAEVTLLSSQSPDESESGRTTGYPGVGAEY